MRQAKTKAKAIDQSLRPSGSAPAFGRAVAALVEMTVSGLGKEKQKQKQKQKTKAKTEDKGKSKYGGSSLRSE
jgi:hypothetical protein